MSEEIAPCKSVYSTKIKEAIESIPQELYSLSEETLRSRVNPTVRLYEIKRAFWEELAFAQERGAKMRVHRIFEGKMHKQAFYRDVLNHPLRMAWITQPLTLYEDKTKAVLDRAVERYDELVNMEITTTKRIKDPEAEDGYRIVTETDPKKALVLLQTIKNLEDRIKGTAIQRQVSVHTGEPKGPRIESASLNMDAVNERLQELEAKLGNGNQKSIEEGSVSELQQGATETDDGKDGGSSQGDDITDVEWRSVPNDKDS
jgi:hypothetical protein